MSSKSYNKQKQLLSSYAFNKTSPPLPEANLPKAEPPHADIEQEDNKHLFKLKIELTNEEIAQEFMNAYKKAERAVVNNFYTGGGAYKKGILDAIYRGFNPLNP